MIKKILFAFMLCQTPSLADSCMDGWASLDALHSRYPTDRAVIRLYALRIGLCTLMEAGKISQEMGAEIFEAEKAAAILETLRTQAERPITN